METVATLQAELLTLDGAHNAKKRKQIKLRIAELDLASAVPIPTLVKAEFGAETMCLSDEIAAEQREELEALAAIYEDDFELKGSPPAKQGDRCGCFTVALSGNCKIAIQFQPNYPASKGSVKCLLECAAAAVDLDIEALLLVAIESELDQHEEGEQCGCVIVGIAQEWARERTS